MENRSCVLFGADPGIVGDVRSALGVIQLQVLAAGDIDQLGNLMAAEPPPQAVLFRPGTREDQTLGLKTASSLRGRPSLREIPFVLIATEGEQSALPAEIPFFDGILTIPVEFPTFTKQVQEFLETFDPNMRPDLPAGGSGGEFEFPDEAPGNAAPSSAQSFQSAGSAEFAADLEERLLIVYAIQVRVLEELRRSEHFSSVPLDKIGSMLMQVTEKVSRSFNKP